ncbi:MAG: SMC-Scp complex subunit ScpB [Candidatus Doudnabacteria bacterium RIFCSPHIGHO2_01_52_17]|uniref:SMC-Scp complex subunit ScpB n=1 Tax=Candidatus Doudnabacteria bacterium RIFCSPHIGHO2_01_52_17 TaxID=1817820 RepID=A0A1F5NC27_9BACT|nr:MAG: SMC-Scp complex subunit ScpB [Candidatus Doudnabacteria bacterium RIFCSPHIGHO2_01_52_17]
MAFQISLIFLERFNGVDLKKTIEAILFVAGRPVNIRELEKTTGAPKDTVTQALSEIKDGRKDSGVILLEQNGAYLLSTNPDCSPQVKDFLNLELREKLTDATLETLAIITYKQPVSRAEIEAIRGVNSQYSLRILMMRGLVERIPSPKDARMHLYRTTHEFLQNLGIRDIKELPDFSELTAKVKPPEGFLDLTQPPQSKNEGAV